MELLDLPAELILMIEGHLPTQADVFALMRCHSCMLAILQQRLYARPRGKKILEIFIFAIEMENERLASAMLNLLDLISHSVFTKMEVGALNIAVLYGQLNMVRLVLKHPKTINKPTPTDYESHTAMMDATVRGHTEILKLLLVQPHLHPQKPSSCFFRATLPMLMGGITSTECKFWDIPINRALNEGNQELVQILLADPRVELNSLSLIAAARGGREDMVRLCLLQYPQKLDPVHESILVIAARANNTKLVKLLLEVASHTSDMKWEMDGNTPFISAANREIPAPDNPLLARNNIDINATTHSGESAFRLSIMHDNVEMMKMLLDTGEVDVDSSDGDGRTPLSYAAEEAREWAVEFLLSLDAVDPNSKNICGMTPLHYAARYGHVEVMKLLLDTGNVDVNSRDIDGQTPLLLAINTRVIGKEAAVQFLISRNQGSQRSRVVAFRCKKRCYRVVKRLLKWIH